MNKANSLKLAFAVFVSVSSLVMFGSPLVHADAPAVLPVSIISVCGDPQSDTAYWRICNANPGVVDVSWENVATMSDGAAALPYGFTTISTSYDSSKSVTEVTFRQNGQPDQVVQLNDTICAPMPEGCVDGYARDNLQLDWSQQGGVSFATKNAALICEDVTVYLSDYTLPKGYSGSGIFDDSSVPQQKFASASAVLKKGTSGGVTLAVAVPDTCADYQLDAYYPPEITTVSYSGSGAQLIYGKIYVHSANNCGGRGGEVQGASTTTPTPPATTPSAVLADTGESPLLPTVIALGIALCAATVNFSGFTKLK